MFGGVFAATKFCIKSQEVLSIESSNVVKREYFWGKFVSNFSIN